MLALKLSVRLSIDVYPLSDRVGYFVLMMTFGLLLGSTNIGAIFFDGHDLVAVVAGLLETEQSTISLASLTDNPEQLCLRIFDVEIVAMSLDEKCRMMKAFMQC